MTTKTTVNIWKFSDTACDFANITSSKAVVLRNKLDAGGKLTREEKNWLTSACYTNSYSFTGVPVMGWMISFSDVLNKYLIKYGSTLWREMYACDITSLRATVCFKIYDIIKR